MSHKGMRLAPSQEFKPKWFRSFTLVNTACAKLSPAQLTQFEGGGKLILPSSLLQELVDKDVFKQDRPVHFRIHSVREMIVCFCGVDQFLLDYQSLCMPLWMQEYTGAREGDSIVLASVELPLCHKLTLKPDTCDFYEIGDAKGALQTHLPNFSAICKGQNFRFVFNGKPLWMKVVHCEPTVASLINCDVNCDFESAEGLERYELDKIKEQVFNCIYGGYEAKVSVQANTASFYVIERSNTKSETESVLGAKSFGGKPRKL